jgi:hypothetical protein
LFFSIPVIVRAASEPQNVTIEIDMIFAAVSAEVGRIYHITKERITAPPQSINFLPANVRIIHAGISFSYGLNFFSHCIASNTPNITTGIE